MPFKSQAQIRKFAELVKQGKISQEKFHQWAKETPSISSLPEKLKPLLKSPKPRK